MGLHKASPQPQEIGSFALRTLWIPILGSILVVGFLALRTPQEGGASPMPVAAASENGPLMHAASTGDATLPRIAASTGDADLRNAGTAALPRDEAVAQHEALDPVGAGHDVSR